MRNKRKGILMASAILGSAAIVSTGFAAWVITAPQEHTVEGNIQVDNVRDDRLAITHSWDAISKGNVYFGRPANMDIANAWLRNDSEQTEIMEGYVERMNKVLDEIEDAGSNRNGKVGDELTKEIE